MSKKNIFKDKDEKVINKKNLSINDFNRKVVLIKTNKKQYVIKSGRNTLIEKKILDFFNKYAEILLSKKNGGLNPHFLFFSPIK